MKKTSVVVAGNWKMSHGPERTRAFFKILRLPFQGHGPEVLIFPPAVSLTAALECPDRDLRVALGAQNIHFEEEGAFTGEISARLAVEAGATHVLVGHSERRHIFGESDADVARKVRVALGHDLIPVICVGETLDQRNAGSVDEVILGQLNRALEGPTGGSSGSFLIAYEPVWAIGTGETATPRDAEAAHQVLRTRLAATLGIDRGAGIPILYGGSVNAENAGDLLAAPEVDGLLVGGASLSPDSFTSILEVACGR